MTADIPGGVGDATSPVAVTVDCVVFGLDEGDRLRVLLGRRSGPPHAGGWALPGAFVRADESLERAALRALEQATDVHDVYLEQLYTFGDPDRDPRGRVVSVAYFALVSPSAHVPVDREHVRWFAVDALPDLAFDHGAIVDAARERLRGKVRYCPIGFELLPDRFPLRRLRALYEALLERPLDKRNFRKKFLSLGLLEELGEHEAGVPHRAARLFRFDRDRYRQLEREGFDYWI